MNRSDFRDAVPLVAQLREHRLLLFGQDRDTSQFRRLINDFSTDWLAPARRNPRIKCSNKKTGADPNTTTDRWKLPPARDKRTLPHPKNVLIIVAIAWRGICKQLKTQ